MGRHQAVLKTIDAEEDAIDYVRHFLFQGINTIHDNHYYTCIYHQVYEWESRLVRQCYGSFEFVNDGIFLHTANTVGTIDRKMIYRQFSALFCKHIDDEINIETQSVYLMDRLVIVVPL